MNLQQPSGTYRGYRTAGIRLGEELLDTLQFHRTDKLHDTIVSIHKFDKAHTVMLTEQGIIPEAAGAAILAALRETEGDQGKARMQAQGGKHSGEQHLIRTLGEDVGGWINTARSSGDLGQIGRHLTARDHILKCMPPILTFRKTLIGLAERFETTIMPGQTFLQHGQPTTLGHWFSMWASVFGRAYARLEDLYERINVSPAGAAIFTGSDFDVDRYRVAELLGFRAPIEHTMDATFSHDTLMEAVSTVALFWSDFGRLADDLELWLSTEYRYLRFPDRYCDTSSIMPQKRNPSLPQQIKAQTVKAIGNLTTAYLAERGASGQSWNPRYETERILWESFGAIPALLHDARSMLSDVEPQEQRMRERSGNGWATSTDLASLIVTERKFPWRTAHQITAIIVRLSEEREIPPGAVDSALVDEAAELYMGQPLRLSDASIAEALDPTAFVARRTLLGGPAPSAHRNTLATLRKALRADTESFTGRRDTVERAQDRLEEAIDRITEGR